MARRPTILAAACVLIGTAILTGWGVERCGAAAGVGPLPPEALRLPQESRFVMGLDVHRFVAGDFYERFAGPQAPARPQSFNELAEQTGVDPEHDVDRVFFAGGLGADGRRGVLLAFGRFDEAQLTKTLEARYPGLVTRKVGEHALHVLSGPPRATAVALMTAGALAIGPTDDVERLLAGKGPGIAANERLATLLRSINTSPTFWMVGDGSAIEMASRSAPGAGGMPLGLPPIESLLVTSEVDPDVTFRAVAEAADAKGARALSQMLNGFLMLATLQAQQKPALRGLPSAVKVEQQDTRVTLSGQLTHDMLAALLPKPAPRTTPQATGSAPVR
jgi:hypothetical protein